MQVENIWMSYLPQDYDLRLIAPVEILNTV